MHISSATVSIREHLHERFKDSFGNTSNDISTRLRRRWRGGALQAGGAPEPEIAETGDEFKVAEYHLETKHDDDNGFVFSIGDDESAPVAELADITETTEPSPETPNTNNPETPPDANTVETPGVRQPETTAPPKTTELPTIPPAIPDKRPVDTSYEFQKLGQWNRRVVFDLRETGPGTGVFIANAASFKLNRDAAETSGSLPKFEVLNNPSFANAVYSGNAIVHRRQETGGGFAEGDARVNINDDFTLDFLFSGIEGVDDIAFGNVEFDDSTVNGVRIRVSQDFRSTKKNIFKGIYANFAGHNNEAIVGAFGGEGIRRGVFGATRDTVEIE